ncbi:MAG: hypothetical protein KC800_12665 [Candidatus Eremiobacteraeota bacterium]|nr:hypothetical protein [Candidatus Eremiobacteraeota bacterium]
MKKTILSRSAACLVAFLLTTVMARAEAFAEKLPTLIGSGQKAEAVALVLENPQEALSLFEKMENLALSGEGDPFFPALILNFVARTYEARLGDTSLRDRLLLAGMLAPETAWVGGPLEKVETPQKSLVPEVEKALQAKLDLDIALRLGCYNDAIRTVSKLNTDSKDAKLLELKAEGVISELRASVSVGFFKGLQENGDEGLAFVRALSSGESEELELEMLLVLATGAKLASQPEILRSRLKAAKALVAGRKGPAANRARFVIKSYEFELKSLQKGTISREEIQRAHDEAWTEIPNFRFDYGRNWDPTLQAFRFWSTLLIEAGLTEPLQKDQERLNSLILELSAANSSWELFTGPILPVWFGLYDTQLDLVAALRGQNDNDVAGSHLLTVERGILDAKAIVGEIKLGDRSSCNPAQGSILRLQARFLEEKGLQLVAEGDNTAFQYLAKALDGYSVSGDLRSNVELSVLLIQYMRLGRVETAKAVSVADQVIAVSRKTGYWPGLVRGLVLRADLAGDEEAQKEAEELVEGYISKLSPENPEFVRNQYLGFLPKLPPVEQGR